MQPCHQYLQPLPWANTQEENGKSTWKGSSQKHHFSERTNLIIALQVWKTPWVEAIFTLTKLYNKDYVNNVLYNSCLIKKKNKKIHHL